MNLRKYAQYIFNKTSVQERIVHTRVPLKMPFAGLALLEPTAETTTAPSDA